MKKILLFLVLLIPIVSFSQLVSLKVSLKDTLSENFTSKATFFIDNKFSTSSENGSTEIMIAPGTYVLTVITDQYKPNIQKVTVPIEGLNVSVSLERNAQGEVEDLPEVSLSENDFENSEGQNVSSLLQSTSDVFVNAASFSFSAANFRMRGYDSENALIYMNGIPVNNMENGRAVWAEWGGLNDALRYKEQTTGINPQNSAIGGVGGITSFNTRASMIRAQNKLSYAISNKSYDNRIMYTYATGLMENNWAFAISGSKRWAGEGFVEGTFYDAYSYLVSAERKLNDKHMLGMTIMAAPYKKGMQAAATQEAYDLTGSNFYNPNWGYQNGEKRNARVRSMNQPKFMLTHNWKINETSSLNTTAGYTFGYYSNTYLNWYNASDPRPDYYRYFPSYHELDTNFYSPGVSNAYTQAWKDGSISQINWDELYQINFLANLEGDQAKYIIEKRNDVLQRIDLSSIYQKTLNNHIRIDAGISGTHYKNRRFKTLDDLLGGEYWIDVDQFAERDFNGDTAVAQNDLENPNKEIKQGDVFGYDYNIFVNNFLLWSVAKMSYNKFDAFIGVNVTSSSFYREGNMQNGRFPDNSKGKSETQSFFGAGLKGGITWKLSGRHYFVANGAYLIQPPTADKAFLSQRIANTIVKGVSNENIISGDISYIHKGIKWNARITAFQTWFKNQTDLKSYYHDDYKTYVNMMLVNIDKVHQGIEVGIDYKISKTISAIAAASLGNYLFTSNPNATINFENASKNDTTEVVYQKYFYVPGSPQTATTFGLKYSHPKFWFFDIRFNYFDKIYLDFNPERRTEKAMEPLIPGDSRIGDVVNQEQIPGGFTLDASLGKSWRLNTSKPLYIGLNLNVNNILDNTELITGGFEQMRFDYENASIRNFNKKYFYSYGRTYFLMVSLRF